MEKKSPAMEKSLSNVIVAEVRFDRVEISEDVVEGRPPPSPRPSTPIPPPTSPTGSDSGNSEEGDGLIVVDEEDKDDGVIHKEMVQAFEKRLVLSEKDFLKQTNIYNYIIGGERAKDLMKIFEGINHQKRASYCEGFYCVYDTRLVRRSLDIQHPHDDKNAFPARFCPLDASAPLGPAYFNQLCQSPLIKICTHENCQPNQSTTYAVIKLLNMDKRPGYQTADESATLTTMHGEKIALFREHHRRGETVVRRLEMMKQNYGKDLDFYVLDGFLIDFLRATRRMPFIFLGEKNHRPEGDFVELMRIGGWKKFWNSNQFRKEVSPQRIINQSELDMLKPYSPLIMNLYHDYIIDLPVVKNARYTGSNPGSIGIPDWQDKFQPLDLCRTWCLTLEHDAFLPMAFYASDDLPSPKELPSNISLAYTYAEQLRVFEEQDKEVLRVRLGSKQKIGLDKGEKGKDLFGLDENKGMIVKYEMKMERPDSDAATYAAKLLRNTSYFIRRSDMEPREVGFVFTAVYLEYMIDSIIDFFILNLDNVANVETDIDYSDRYNRYVEGHGFKPDYQFVHMEDFRLANEILDQSRSKADFMTVLRGLDRACITLEQSEDHQVNMIRRLTSKDEVMTFKVSIDELLVILKKLCRFHMYHAKKLGLKGLGGNALRYALVRLSTANDYIFEYDQFCDVDTRDRNDFVEKSYEKKPFDFEEMARKETDERALRQDDWEVILYHDRSPAKRRKIDDVRPDNVPVNYIHIQ